MHADSATCIELPLLRQCCNFGISSEVARIGLFNSRLDVTDRLGSEERLAAPRSVSRLIQARPDIVFEAQGLLRGGQGIGSL
jgi:hypothetical protein